MDLKSKIVHRTIASDKSIIEALKQMDEIDKKLLFVFKEDAFVNILSIGDLQRAIISNKPLDTPVVDVLRENTTMAYHLESFEAIRARMLEYRAECMPVLDQNGQLVDVHFWEDIFPSTEKRVQQHLNLPVVIMAGGRGSRLKPITNVLPKALIPIGQKSIIEHIMEHFINAGCGHFMVSVNYKAEMIRHYLSSLEDINCTISYVHEKKPLGTAGSLSLFRDKIDGTFFVSNCDIIIEEDYSEIFRYHQENENEITVVAALKHYKIPYGTVDTTYNGRLTALHEKPEFTYKINSGLYILEPHLLHEVPEAQFYHLTDLIDAVKTRKGKVGVFPVSERSWRDIGNWDQYLSSI